MADYKQEQKEEIEAIESIYSDEMKMISENPYKFSIAVKTEDYDEEEEDTMRNLIIITLTTRFFGGSLIQDRRICRFGSPLRNIFPFFS